MAIKVKKKRKVKPFYRPRYDVFVGKCAAFLIDNKSKKTDIVCDKESFTFNGLGDSNCRQVAHRMRVKCARLNREHYLEWIKENG